MWIYFLDKNTYIDGCLANFYSQEKKDIWITKYEKLKCLYGKIKKFFGIKKKIVNFNKNFV